MSRARLALAAAAFVAAAGLIGATPLVDAETHRAVTDATLVIPLGYDIIAPVCNTLDALTLLSLQQHIALFATLAVGMIAWRVLAHRRYHTSWTREVGIGVAAFVTWLAVYGIAALLPRPMAAIALHNPDDLTVDFHSHTDASWDGRRGFSPERNRTWHTQAGFDVAYVSDHKSLAGALQGSARNPARATGQTILLPAIEARDHYQHVVAIGIDTAAPTDPKGNWHDPQGDTTPGGRFRAPMLILTIPGNVTTLPPNERSGVARVMAVELSDAAPRGLNQIQRHKRDILALADRLQLAVVAGSDNHGWGSTAAGWSVLHIPGWRALRPTQLDSAIRGVLRDERRSAVRVYLRDTPDPGASWIALALTLPAVVWRMLACMSWPERGGWIVWIFIVAALHWAYNSAWGRTRKRGGASPAVHRPTPTITPSTDTTDTATPTP